MPFPFQAARAKKEVRKSKRAEKRADNAALMAKNGSESAQGSIEPMSDGPRQAKSRKSKPRRLKRKKSPTLSMLKKKLWSKIAPLVRSWSVVCLACGVNPTSCAAHIVPSNDGAATRFFLPNLYPACHACNKAEHHQRGSWVYRHREIFGADVVDALYSFSETTFQLKKDWVLEQTERMNRLLGAA